MIKLQRFKESDETEAKVIAVAMPILDDLGEARDEFYEGAYSAWPLGELLYDLKKDPLSGVITRDVFVRSFPAIHQLFTRPGTFEFYMTVFRQIWGDNVQIVFGIPSPGVLTINAKVLDVENFFLVARRIFGPDYVYDPIVDHEGDNILVRATVGIKTQTEISALMNELAPAGIFVITTLEI